MGLEHIKLDKILTRNNRPLRRDNVDVILDKIDPKYGTVVVKREFEGIGTFYCTVLRDLLLLKRLREGKDEAEVYVLDKNDCVHGKRGWLQNAAEHAFGGLPHGTSAKPKDLVSPWIKTMEAPYPEFRRIRELRRRELV